MKNNLLLTREGQLQNPRKANQHCCLLQLGTVLQSAWANSTHMLSSLFIPLKVLDTRTNYCHSGFLWTSGFQTSVVLLLWHRGRASPKWNYPMATPLTSRGSNSAKEGATWRVTWLASFFFPASLSGSLFPRHTHTARQEEEIQILEFLLKWLVLLQH